MSLQEETPSASVYPPSIAGFTICFNVDNSRVDTKFLRGTTEKGRKEEVCDWFGVHLMADYWFFRCVENDVDVMHCVGYFHLLISSLASLFT